MPLVIFDGPEAAGKTTIIDALIEEWGPNSRQRSWGPQDSWMQYCQPLFDDIQECEKDVSHLVVWSRSWLSRTVYNKLLSQGQIVPSSVTKELDDIVIRSGGLLVFVSAPVVTLLSRRLARLDEENAKPDHPIDPHKELAEFQAQTRQRKWVSLSGTTEVNQNIRSIMNYLVQRNPECRMTSSWRGGET